MPLRRAMAVVALMLENIDEDRLPAREDFFAATSRVEPRLDEPEDQGMLRHANALIDMLLERAEDPARPEVAEAMLEGYP